MFAVRTATRAAAVMGAATALTVAGAGAAMAAETTYEVDGNTLAVTFEKEAFLDVAVCFAAVIPTAGAAGVVDQFHGAAVRRDRSLTTCTTLAHWSGWFSHLAGRDFS